MPVFCLFTLGRHGYFTAGVTQEQPDLLCTALALNIELLSIIVCAVLETSYQNENQSIHKRSGMQIYSCISSPVLVGFVYCFVDRCLFFCPFVLYLLVLVRSVLYQLTASDYSFGIFKIFYSNISNFEESEKFEDTKGEIRNEDEG